MSYELTNQQYVDYFEHLATQMTDIGHSTSEKHFVKAGMEELLEGNKGPQHYPALILETYEVNWINNQSDNLLKRRLAAFQVLDLINRRSDDYDKEEKVLTDMEKICDNILARMRYDQRQQHHLMYTFRIQEDIVYQKVGGDWYLDGALGWRVEIPLVNPQGLAIDKTKWGDL